MLTAFTASLLLTTISEVGDKTFFIAAILAMRHSRRVVFAGASAALAVMTVLSVAMGQVASLLPKHYVAWAEILLFLGFGLKLLYEASQISPKVTATEGCQEAEAAIAQQEAKFNRHTQWAVLAQAFGMTFVAEWGDRTQFTTIALAAANNPVGVTLGAILGHILCAAIAVQCGRYVCGKLSERTLLGIGGALFILFAGVGLVELLH
ncbi:MAG: TMEM165/GDT1 family protein [Drouetiella hepatica Uher 2000/2452]|jgi:putative Ca2+/H+ antiporter (TMEM165/GDT1 family)|uniref:GDT1 family protein n=1 Tax=Drouetiella hepatica Uher 2000/2452 TaxID=904376 RepID=A0A951ULL3_9CYAN|nr:TMEM165/GDT1 family protein [Drouetiella hepatica Uher 2000/2452]